VRGVDPVDVGEPSWGGAGVDPVAVGEAPAWTRRRWRHGGEHGGGAGARVMGKMIVVRVRI
jgi:hypothetical protein